MQAAAAVALAGVACSRPSFASIAANGLVIIALTEQTGSPTYATIASCTTKSQGRQLNKIFWTKPWIP